LQLLYPCSRYSPDQCLICGGSFRDHLVLWWAKHLYTPYDRIIDETYEQGVILLDENGEGVGSNKKMNKRHRNRNNSAKRISRSGQTRSSPPAGDSSSKEYAFHRQYVLDKSHLLKGISNKREQTRLLAQELSKCGMRDGNVDEMQVNQRGVQYLVASRERRTSLTLKWTRAFVLATLEHLIELEGTEAEGKSR